MTVLGTVTIGLGAVIGTLLRYEVGRYFSRRTSGTFPWGTWVVNVMGSWLFGLFARAFDSPLHHSPYAWLFLGSGFCGGFTTFSTMSLEAMQLFQTRRWYAIAYLSSSFACGLLLAWMAQWL